MSHILTFIIILIYNILWSVILKEYYATWRYWAIFACVLAYGAVCMLPC